MRFSVKYETKIEWEYFSLSITPEDYNFCNKLKKVPGTCYNKFQHFILSSLTKIVASLKNLKIPCQISDSNWRNVL